MKRREVSRKFDEIVEFSGIEQSRHASEALLRFRHVCAAGVLCGGGTSQPEILVVDEVLAVPWVTSNFKRNVWER